MKITICGSIAFINEMKEAKVKLETMNHAVHMPPLEVPDEKGNMIPVKQYWDARKVADTETGWLWQRKAEAMKEYFEKISWADAILVLNYDKNGTPNYIGGNVLIEMGVAFHLGKLIYLLNPIPEIAYKEEILAMKPIVINGNLALLK